MIYTYATTPGQEGTALSLAVMVGLCLLGQVWLVWLQTHKGPTRVMLREMLIALSAAKVRANRNFPILASSSYFSAPSSLE
jgi:hypothetical protein